MRNKTPMNKTPMKFTVDDRIRYFGESGSRWFDNGPILPGRIRNGLLGD